jgi:transposase
MGNTIGSAQLELYRAGSDTPAVLGTDYVVRVDGRWTYYRAVDYVESVAREACARTGLEWRRGLYLLGGRRRSVTI